MSWTKYANYHSELPDSKVLLYHSKELNPARLSKFGMFSSVMKVSKHLLITDVNVAKLHLSQMMACLESLDLQICPIIIASGEGVKNLQTYETILDTCTDIGLDKHSTVISFGGGVVKDVAGFVASTLFRGINLVHIPTTVLAQVDAAIDWKQALNLPQGKNLIGSMYAPSEIWVNAIFTQTLEERWIRDGLGESVKIAICRSPQFLDLLLLGSISDIHWLAKVVDMSVSLKTQTMRRDSEADEAVKQYGHAVGHAIEHLSSGTLGHGESIAIGMCVSAELGLITGICNEAVVQQHYDICNKLKLPTTLPDYQQSDQVWTQIRFDKHFVGDKMYAPVLRTVGRLAENKAGNVMLPFSRDSVVQALERTRRHSHLRTRL